MYLYSSAGGPYPSAANADGYQPAPADLNGCTGPIVRMHSSICIRTHTRGLRYTIQFSYNAMYELNS